MSMTAKDRLELLGGLLAVAGVGLCFGLGAALVLAGCALVVAVNIAD